tara:strand:- start:1004 stop:1279 length:276 start_codon:yes stop_codon:yes gene_type:complete
VIARTLASGMRSNPPSLRVAPMRGRVARRARVAKHLACTAAPRRKNLRVLHVSPSAMKPIFAACSEMLAGMVKVVGGVLSPTALVADNERE